MYKSSELFTSRDVCKIIDNRLTVYVKGTKGHISKVDLANGKLRYLFVPTGMEGTNLGGWVRQFDVENRLLER